MDLEADIAAISKISEFSIRDLKACFAAIKLDQACSDAAAFEWLTEAVYIAIRLGIHVITVSSIMNTVLLKQETNHKNIPIYGWN